MHTLIQVVPESCKVASLLGLQASLRGVSIVERVGKQQSWRGLRHTLGVSAKLLTLGQGFGKSHMERGTLCRHLAVRESPKWRSGCQGKEHSTES